MKTLSESHHRLQKLDLQLPGWHFARNKYWKKAGKFDFVSLGKALNKIFSSCRGGQDGAK